MVLDAEAGGAACELEVCEVCEVTKKRRGRKEVPMLECDKCLRGYHLDCLDPPLAAVPEVALFCSLHSHRSECCFCSTCSLTGFLRNSKLGDFKL